MRPEAIKHLEEKSPWDWSWQQFFVDEIKSTSNKNKQMGLHKSPHNRRKKSTKGKATYGMGSKISANHKSDTRLISNYIRNSCNSIAKKQIIWWKNGKRTLDRHFSKEEIQVHEMATRYMKMCSTSLTAREMQIKITVRYHFTLVRVTTIKKNRNNICWWG